MIVDNFSALSAAECYAWMTGAVIPRPVAWILTQNDNGGGDDDGDNYNLAPFSYFNALCSAPPLVGISFTAGAGGAAKDTLTNIRRNGSFVAHIAPMTMLDALNDSSAPLPYGESEVSKSGLQTADFWHLPRVRGCPIAMACRLSREVPLHNEDDAEQILILGEIVRLFVDDAVLADDGKGRRTIDAAKTNPIARLSAGNYASIANFQTRTRPQK
ncbi:MAG: flavin reductase family protein [Gammaproteobacteria bacterium]